MSDLSISQLDIQCQTGDGCFRKLEYIDLEEDEYYSARLY
jgi:hypothetical protein